MIRAGAFDATLRSLAVLVALAVQIVAIAVIGDVFHDVFVSTPRLDDAPAPPSDTLARAAPAARADRLMTINLALDLVSVDRAMVAAPVANAPEVAAAPVEAAPAGEPAPEAQTLIEPAPPLIAEPIPQLRPDPTAAPQPTPAAPVITTSSATVEAELRMLYLMNASRMLAGLVPLALDIGVSDAARKHSAVEAQNRYVYHDGPDGTARSRYVPACGSGWYGENTGKVWSGGVEVLHREFMAEPWEPINHRTNIMDPNFRRVGIGAVQGPDAVYITMAFCR